MDHIYLGVNFPAPKNYERIRVENVNLKENVSVLIEKFRELTGHKEDDVSFVYCGNVLEDNEPINRFLRSGSTVHVLRKFVEEEPKEYKKITELDVSRLCSLYRSLNSGNFHKISRPEVAKAIFDAYPEIKKDVVAMSFLKDPILLSNMQNPDTVRKIGQHHRVLIEASETIVAALKSAKNLTEPTPAPVQPIIDDLSDSSSSSSGSEHNASQAAGSSSTRQITREYLRQSLAAAQGRNSLNNISQRNLSQAGGSESNPISPSTSSGSVPAGHRFISSSMFLNAMNEVLNSSRRSAAAEGSQDPSTEAPVVTEAPPAPEPEEEEEEVDEVRMEEDRAAQDAHDVELITRFHPLLTQMEDMGLRNRAHNVRALMLCNGDLEAAVNLILANNEMS